MRQLLSSCLFIAVALLVTPLTVAADFSLLSVFEGLAKQSPSVTRFVEQKTIAEFEAPIESTGELSYKAPARLEKRTLRPDVETLILDDDLLIVERGEFRREIPVADMPAIGAFVASLRGFVSGNLANVEQAFELSLSGDVKKWVIKGRPVNDSVKKIVDSIEVSGSAGLLKVFIVTLTSGDSSTMTLIQ